MKIMESKYFTMAAYNEDVQGTVDDLIMALHRQEPFFKQITMDMFVALAAALRVSMVIDRTTNRVIVFDVACVEFGEEKVAGIDVIVGELFLFGKPQEGEFTEIK